MRLVFALALVALTQDSAKDPAGKVDWVRDLEFGLFKAKIEGRAAAIHSTGGFTTGTRMASGPFSDPKLVAASTRVVPILLGPDEPNKELAERYVAQYSYALVYVDPSGIKIRESESYYYAGDKGAITSDLEGLGRKYPGKPSMWQNSVKGALAMGKLVKKPVAVYLADPKASIEESHTQLMKDLGDRKIKFLWVFHRGKTSEYGVTAAPAIVVLDAKADDPAKAPAAVIEIKESDDKDSVNKALDEALKSLKK